MTGFNITLVLLDTSLSISRTGPYANTTLLNESARVPTNFSDSKLSRRKRCRKGLKSWKGRNDIYSSFSKVNNPTVTHQCLMAALDSPLNKEKRLNIFLVTNTKKIIKVSSNFRVPRTWKMFNKVMVNFLRDPKGVLSAEDCDDPLLQVLEPPINKYLDSNSTCIEIDNDAERKSLKDLNSLWRPETPLVVRLRCEGIRRSTNFDTAALSYHKINYVEIYGDATCSQKNNLDYSECDGYNSCNSYSMQDGSIESNGGSINSHYINIHERSEDDWGFNVHYLRLSKLPMAPFVAVNRAMNGLENLLGIS